MSVEVMQCRGVMGKAQRGKEKQGGTRVGKFALDSMSQLNSSETRKSDVHSA